MKLDTIEEKAIQTYNLNMAYLKEKNRHIYEKVSLYETALELGKIKNNYKLEYKDEEYFDVLKLEDNSYFYDTNSIDYSRNIINNKLSLNPKESSFKTFYEFYYDNEVAQKGLDCTMYSSSHISNAPIVHYVNNNLPEKVLLKTIPKFIIFGTGLGLHLPFLHRKIKSKGYLIVEPSLEMFRLSLFVTEYNVLGNKVPIIFSIAEDEASFSTTFESFYTWGFAYNHYLKFLMLTENFDFYIRIIQNRLVSQSHLVYSYDRLFKSLTRTNRYINEEYKILNVLNKHNLDFKDKPVLLLASGPSLERNIKLVKDNQNKFIIFSVYSAIHILEKYEIKPDVMVQYDENEPLVMDFYNRIENPDFFKDTIFLLSSHVTEKLFEKFDKDKVFVFQAMFALKKEYGFLTSPSIGEITYSLILRFGVEKIYLLGLDMAMDPETNETHISTHQVGTNVEKKSEEESSDNKFDIRKNTIRVKGNFVDEVKTLPLFKMSINTLNLHTKILKSKDQEIYNLNNGAYFENTIPLKPEDINISKFEELNKLDIIEEINKSFSSISSIGYSKSDNDNLLEKIKDAKELKKFIIIEKDSSITVFENRISELITKLVLIPKNCNDLQVILKNYIHHNLHYIYYLFNIQGLSNGKRHIKQISKLLNLQLTKIIDTYIQNIENSLK